jgi:hypothetical protein
MTDIYNPAPAAPAPESGGADGGGRGATYRGMRRTNRRTGEVQVWVQGQGYLPEDSTAALPRGDQDALDRARGLLGTSRRNVQLSEEFLEHNRNPRVSPLDSGGETGGLTALPVPAWSGLQNNTRQRMEGITNQMVRANIQPGQAGTMNSIIEQMLARQQYPSVETAGPVNFDRTLSMLVDHDEITALVDEAERWGREHRGLQGFDVYWTRERSPQIRQESERRHRQRFQSAWNRPGETAGVDVGRAAGNATPARPPSVPADATWNSQTRRWEQ